MDRGAGHEAGATRWPSIRHTTSDPQQMRYSEPLICAWMILVSPSLNASDFIVFQTCKQLEQMADE